MNSRGVSVLGHGGGVGGQGAILCRNRRRGNAKGRMTGSEGGHRKVCYVSWGGRGSVLEGNAVKRRGHWEGWEEKRGMGRKMKYVEVYYNGSGESV